MAGDFFQGRGGWGLALILSSCEGGLKLINFCLMRGGYDLVLGHSSSVPLRPFANPVECCWMLLRAVAPSLEPVKLFTQQLPTFLLFPDRRSVAQQCWIRLHSSSNIVGATHAHYVWITKTYGLYSSHDALQVPNLLGVVASVCAPLPTGRQHLPTLLAQQCWALLRPFARSLR